MHFIERLNVITLSFLVNFVVGKCLKLQLTQIYLKKIGIFGSCYSAMFEALVHGAHTRLFVVSAADHYKSCIQYFSLPPSLGCEQDPCFFHL